MTTKLPSELDYEILGYLADDLPSLGNCSLASQAWLAAARPYKFREVKLSYKHQLIKLLDALNVCPGLGDLVKSVTIGRRFIQRENSPASPWSPTELVSFINRLNVVAVPSQRYVMGPVEGRAYNSESAGDKKIRRKRSKVDIYEGRRQDQNGGMTQLVSQAFAHFTSLEKLSLASCTISPENLTKIIGIVSTLRQLDLHECVALAPLEVNPKNVGSSGNVLGDLRRITVHPSSNYYLPRRADVYDVLDYLADVDMFHKAESLHLEITHKRSLRKALSLVRNLKRALVEVKIRFGYGDRDDDVIKYLQSMTRALSKCSRLRHLSLIDDRELTRHFNSKRGNLRWLNLYDLLRGLSSTSLEHLVIQTPQTVSKATDSDEDSDVTFTERHAQLVTILATLSSGPLSTVTHVEVMCRAPQKESIDWGHRKIILKETYKKLLAVGLVRLVMD
ncbi:hypothetical protein EIP91_005326 [Steccherinum ochraceum]|uniref:F-box domain-containing protein n=1 Tax=Steccherinum ochraceum TaxID=92696 RepID=A0A4R0RDE7_9APHY|nr:hypothetical protein EIP91_005326 [Steccherinum ochraceum]